MVRCAHQHLALEAVRRGRAVRQSQVPQLRNLGDGGGVERFLGGGRIGNLYHHLVRGAVLGVQTCEQSHWINRQGYCLTFIGEKRKPGEIG